MAFKDITALRKSGNLEAALEIARADYNLRPEYWECSALFWCLNEKYKIILDLDERKIIVDEMHELARKMQDNNAFITKALTAADDSILPQHNEIRLAEVESKEGDALTAYYTVLSFFNNGKLPISQYESFGWIIYRALHQNKKILTIERRRMLNNYLKLQLPRPSILHSCILSEAINTERTNPNEFLFTKFIEMWNLDNLRDEDWKNAKTQKGIHYPSQVERMITLFSKEIQVVSTAMPTEKFMSVLQKAIKKWPENENLLRDKALALTKLGKTNEAICVYKQLILKSPTKFYLWSEMAMLVESTKEKISLLCKALSIKIPEEFLGKLHFTLADILIKQNNFEWAKAELNTYKSIYERNKWNIKKPFMDLYKMIPTETEAKSQDYSKYFDYANALIYSNIPSHTLIKISDSIETIIDKKTQKQKKVHKWTLLNKDGETIKIKPHIFNLQSSSNGQCFEAKISAGQIHYIKKVNTLDSTWIKPISGKINIKTNHQNKRFAFLDDSYIHEKNLAKIKDGDNIEGIAVLRKGKWQCIFLTQK